MKSTSGSLLNAVLQDKETKKFTIRDELNARDVILTPHQIRLVQHIQAGSFAYPELDVNPNMIDYYSSIKEDTRYASNPPNTASF
eukprot:4174804-Ditylum_brightwellii.AAC.1